MTDSRTIILALLGRWYGRYGLAFCPAHPNLRTPALRFAPDAWHMTAKRAPAMIGLVLIGNDSIGIHRTWLAEPGRKADLIPAKAMLGPCKGGAVRLSDGAGPLLVAEGIETALSLHNALGAPGTRVWAALSTAGVAGLRLPDPPGDLIVAPDGDAPGRKAADTLATRAHALGWKVRMMQAPPGRDWNDLAMEGAT